MLGGVLALALAASGLSADQARALQQRVPPALSGPLAKLRDPLSACIREQKPSVAHLRARLKDVRELERAARPLLTQGVKPEQVHGALALCWSRVAELEGALAIEGEGDRAERDAVRTAAAQRAQDADTLAADEYALMHAPLTTLDQALKQRMPALQACWREHLMRTAGAADTLDVKLSLDWEALKTSVTFEPALTGHRLQLGECLATRALGVPRPPPDQPVGVELPLHLTAPER